MNELWYMQHAYNAETLHNNKSVRWDIWINLEKYPNNIKKEKHITKEYQKYHIILSRFKTCKIPHIANARICKENMHVNYKH